MAAALLLLLHPAARRRNCLRPVLAAAARPSGPCCCRRSCGPDAAALRAGSPVSFLESWIGMGGGMSMSVHTHTPSTTISIHDVLHAQPNERTVCCWRGSNGPHGAGGPPARPPAPASGARSASMLLGGGVEEPTDRRLSSHSAQLATPCPAPPTPLLPPRPPVRARALRLYVYTFPPLVGYKQPRRLPRPRLLLPTRQPAAAGPGGRVV